MSCGLLVFAKKKKKREKKQGHERSTRTLIRLWRSTLAVLCKRGSLLDFCIVSLSFFKFQYIQVDDVLEIGANIYTPL